MGLAESNPSYRLKDVVARNETRGRSRRMPAEGSTLGGQGIPSLHDRIQKQLLYDGKAALAIPDFAKGREQPEGFRAVQRARSALISAARSAGTKIRTERRGSIMYAEVIE